MAGHSQIPLTRRFTHPLGEAALTKEYFDVMDPFVTLSAAAAISKQLKLGTAICLVIQRDTIQTAKLVASLDPVSTGCFLFGIGCGWNAEEMEDLGTVYETCTLKLREQIVRRGGRRRRRSPEGTAAAPVSAKSAWRDPHGDGILPAAPSAGSGSGRISCRASGKMAEEAGRDPASLSMTSGGAPKDLALLRRNRDLRVTGMTVRLPPAKEEEILPIHAAGAVPKCCDEHPLARRYCAL